jgi:hypothetical protein
MVKEKLIKLLRWLLYNLEEPCPKGLVYETTERSDIRGYITGYPQFGRFTPLAEIEIYTLNKDRDHDE